MVLKDDRYIADHDHCHEFEVKMPLLNAHPDIKWARLEKESISLPPFISEHFLSYVLPIQLSYEEIVATFARCVRLAKRYVGHVWMNCFSILLPIFIHLLEPNVMFVFNINLYFCALFFRSYFISCHGMPPWYIHVMSYSVLVKCHVKFSMKCHFIFCRVMSNDFCV